MNLAAIKGRELISAAADWVEVTAISSSRRRCSGKELARSLEPLAELFEEGDDGELLTLDNVDEEILNRGEEEWIGDILEEINFRADSLGSNYPFVLRLAASDWWVEWIETDHVPSIMYEVCLIVTAARDGLLDPKPTKLDAVVQLASYLASGSLIAGESHWLAHPRPDHSGFKASLETWLQRMGYRNPQLQAPSWSYRNEQDAGIDIICWKGFADRLPGRLVVFGQVASGRTEWKDKSVKGYLQAQIGPWLGELMPETLIEALFVPWPLYSEVNQGARNKMSGSIRSFRDWAHAEGLLLEKKLGIVVDRERLVELAARGIDTGLGDETAKLASLREWHGEAIQLIRG